MSNEYRKFSDSHLQLQLAAKLNRLDELIHSYSLGGSTETEKIQAELHRASGIISELSSNRAIECTESSRQLRDLDGLFRFKRSRCSKPSIELKRAEIKRHRCRA